MDIGLDSVRHARLVRDFVMAVVSIPQLAESLSQSDTRLGAIAAGDTRRS